MKRFFIFLAAAALLASCGATANVDLSVNDVEKTPDGVKVTIQNSGTSDAGEFTLSIELSKGGNPVGDFNKKVSGVKAGSERVVETSFSGSEYDFMYVKVDSKDAVAETDEGNNEFGA